MNYLNICVPKNTEIAVVGDIHEHEYQYNLMLEKLKPSQKLWIVSAGDIYDKGFGKSAAERITQSFINMQKSGYAFAVQGNHEKRNLKRAKAQQKMTKYLEWFESQPLVLSFVFENTTRLTVLHGGVKPSHKWEDMNVDVETCYIQEIDDKGEMVKAYFDPISKKMQPKVKGTVWHHFYDGKFGYIASGHQAQKDGLPKFYNYSCNIDTSCYSTGILTAQIFNENGRSQLVTVKGPAKGE